MRNAAALSLAVLATLLGACGGDSEPVARLSMAGREIVLPHGAMVPTELRIEPLRPLEEGKEPILFVHLLDGEGSVARTFDHRLPGPWRVGETIVDQVPVVQPVLAPALAPGDYRLTVGLYDGADHRWPLAGAGEEAARREYVIATVRVPAEDLDGPRFVFSEEWLPIEPAEDRQNLARRWLSGDGTLRVSRLPGPARLSMLLRIPEPHENLLLALEPEATTPTVRVTTDCGGFAATVQGSGFHALEVPVSAAGDCVVSFDANYALNDTASPRKLSLAIERLGWSRAGGDETTASPADSAAAEPGATPAPAPSPSPSPPPAPASAGATGGG